MNATLEQKAGDEITKGLAARLLLDKLDFELGDNGITPEQRARVKEVARIAFETGFDAGASWAREL